MIFGKSKEEKEHDRMVADFEVAESKRKKSFMAVRELCSLRYIIEEYFVSIEHWDRREEIMKVLVDNANYDERCDFFAPTVEWHGRIEPYSCREYKIVLTRRPKEAT